MTEQNSITFLGLGALGSPIAANLVASGHSVTVWNRTASKMQPLVEKGAKASPDPVAAVTPGGVVFSLLWDDASLEELAGRQGFLERLGPQGLHISMTTVTPQASRKVAALHQSKGVHFVEAPIFGVPAQAQARQLMVCLAGEAGDKARAKPLLEAMGAAKVFDFGEKIGAGTATKLIGNFMIVSAFGAMQEAFQVLTASGVDPKPTLDMLTTTLLATPGNQRYAGYLLSGKPMPKSGIPLKDVGLFEHLAGDAKSPAPLASALREFLRRQAEGR